MPRQKKKFIDKNNAQTFQLVHRSQKDPLAADEEAPQHVLLPMGEAKDGTASESANQREERISKQREFGIGFDDEYDYFQHLKVVEQEPAVLVPVNPHVETTQDKKVSFELPSEVFASGYEEEVGMLHRAIPPVGPQVDWDPDVVAAMDEDFDYTNPDNELEDNFILIADPIDEEYEDCESEYSDMGSNCGSFGGDFDEEETKSRFTEYSMSSSVLPRSKNFETLDDRFEKFYEMYDDENVGDIAQADIDGNLPVDSVDDSETLKQLLGLNPTLFTRTTEYDDKLPKQYYTRNIAEDAAEKSDDSTDEDLVVIEREEPDKKWDCESILSTYSNIYNHPKIIDIPKPIKVSREGVPLNVLRSSQGLTQKDLKQLDRQNAELDARYRNDSESHSIATTVCSNIRDKNETKEEKSQRKQAFKAARRERRIEKKATKLAFTQEQIRQKKEMINVQNNFNGIKIL